MKRLLLVVLAATGISGCYAEYVPPAAGVYVGPTYYRPAPVYVAPAPVYVRPHRFWHRWY